MDGALRGALGIDIWDLEGRDEVIAILGGGCEFLLFGNPWRRRQEVGYSMRIRMVARRGCGIVGIVPGAVHDISPGLRDLGSRAERRRGGTLWLGLILTRAH